VAEAPAGAGENMPDDTRALDITVDIDAPIEDVWRALTDADELVRWFPLVARVTPGTGGTMHWSWGDAWSGIARIDAWDPPRLLRLVDEYRGFDAEGRPRPDVPRPSGSIVMEFTLETREGKTRLRLVHSGFGSGGHWDDEYDATGNGWAFELGGLRHYLERHRGRNRHFGWARAATSLSAEAVWARLLHGDAFAVDPTSPRAGSPFELRTAAGDRLAGTVALFIPHAEFSGIVPELHDGVLRLSTHRADDRVGVLVSLASYQSQDAPSVTAFTDRAQQILDRLFAGT
jgi:uncharacterized protein YndB with AHSA1/START domain